MTGKEVLKKCATVTQKPQVFQEIDNAARLVYRAPAGLVQQAHVELAAFAAQAALGEAEEDEDEEDEEEAQDDVAAAAGLHPAPAPLAALQGPLLGTGLLGAAHNVLQQQLLGAAPNALHQQLLAAAGPNALMGAGGVDMELQARLLSQVGPDALIPASTYLAQCTPAVLAAYCTATPCPDRSQQYLHCLPGHGQLTAADDCVAGHVLHSSHTNTPVVTLLPTCCPHPPPPPRPNIHTP
jgi:hypothetical protein